MPETLTDAQISDAVTLMRSMEAKDDTAVFVALVGRGVSRSLAVKLVEFLPMAYCRVMFASAGVRFSDSYKRASETRKLLADPEWLAAYKFANSEVQRGVSTTDLISIAGRSAEFQTVNVLLNRGSKLKDLNLTETVLIWPKDGPAI